MDCFDVGFVAFNIRNPANYPSSLERQIFVEIAGSIMLHVLEVR